MPLLHLTSDDFHTPRFSNPPSPQLPALEVSWQSVLSAAVMVGRANWTDVFRHGPSSDYEFIFRLALVATTIHERPALTNPEFACTSAFRALDPSEKGALSYFMGLTFCLVMARRWLNVPALMHLDIYRQRYGVNNPGRSRPDMFGRDGAGRWVVFESKGRTSKPTTTDMDAAKVQAGRATRIGPHAVLSGIALSSYFTDADALRIWWRDPDPKKEGENLLATPTGPVNLGFDEFLEDYYRPIIQLSESYPDAARLWSTGDMLPLPKADVSVGMFPKIWELLRQADYAALARQMSALADSSQSAGFELDGVRVLPGPSWSESRILPDFQPREGR